MPMVVVVHSLIRVGCCRTCPDNPVQGLVPDAQPAGVHKLFANVAFTCWSNEEKEQAQR